jgi:hypothetical protein
MCLPDGDEIPERRLDLRREERIIFSVSPVRADQEDI